MDKIPTSYRCLKNVTSTLLKHFNIEPTDDFTSIKDIMLEKLGADFWGMGHNICYFSTFHARYEGPPPSESYIQDDCMFHVLGIRAIAKRVAEFDYEYPRFLDPPLASIESTSEINENFLISKLKYFDFSHMVNLHYEQKDKILRKSFEANDYKISVTSLIKNNEFIAMGSFNSLFMICSYLRGMDRFLMDIAGNKKLAEKIIQLTSQYCLEYNRRELESFGPQAEFYCSWDDVATQEDRFSALKILGDISFLSTKN
ncbi:MAG: hypothetical protein U5N58_01550 [Actinomycetota bacterium]|nr:hypothetical protein [Actinomycetota bacterium]